MLVGSSRAARGALIFRFLLRTRSARLPADCRLYGCAWRPDGPLQISSVCQHRDILQDRCGRSVAVLKHACEQHIHLAPGCTKPATPMVSLTCTLTARFPGVMIAVRPSRQFPGDLAFHTGSLGKSLNSAARPTASLGLQVSAGKSLRSI